MKRFVAESHLARMLIVDFRPHLMFGTQERPMAKTAALLAANLAWEGFALQEPIGLVIVPDLFVVRPRRGRGHVLFMLKHLEEHYANAVAQTEHPGAKPLVDAIDLASSNLGTGDEICLFSDFGDIDSSLSKKVRELNGIRNFRAILVEDAMLHDPVPVGRYPYQTVENPRRNLATVSKSRADQHAENVESLRSTARRELIKDGWRITEAARAGLLAPGSER